jgi:hypothetical protein
MNQVRPNNLLALLDRTTDAILFDNLSDFSGLRHEVLQRAGEPTTHVYFPTAGMISCLTVMSDGEAVETASVRTTTPVSGQVKTKRSLGGDVLP